MAKRPTAAGIEMTSDQIRVAVVQHTSAGDEVLATRCYDLEGATYLERAEEISYFLSRHSRPGVLRFSLALPAALVRVVELPFSNDATLEQLVSFEIERHVPFAAADIQSDYCRFSTIEEGMARLLTVSVPSGIIRQVQQLRDEVCSRAHLAKSATCTLTCLAEAESVLNGSDGDEAIAVVDARSTQTEVTMTDGCRSFVKRTLNGLSGDLLRKEVRRSLGGYASRNEGRRIDRCVLVGDRAEELSETLHGEGGIHLRALDTRSIFTCADPEVRATGSFFGAAAAATQDPSGRFPINLLKQRDARRKLRRRSSSRTIVGLALTALAAGTCFMYGRNAIEEKRDGLRKLDAHMRVLRDQVAATDPVSDTKTPSTQTPSSALPGLRRTAESAANDARRSSFIYLELLRTLSIRLPAGMWLTELSGKQKSGSKDPRTQIVLKGSAETSDLIGQAVEALEGSNIFSEVELVYTQSARFGNRDVFEFQVHGSLK
ncbi:MAG: PilN domain-containing protein [Armatimonadetes bacterium]|nr:PilN domain-containing protein [Armatimonadota bacterium]